MCALRREKRGRSAGTVRRELGVLRAAINRAHKNGRTTRPVAVELPERPEARDRWLTRIEAARLLRAARTPQVRLYMPLFVLIGLYTGRRKQAILGLRWPDVDLVARTIDFEVAGRARTKKRRGIIKIPPRLLPHLCRARKRGADLVTFCTPTASALVISRRASPLPAGALASRAPRPIP
jgi:integrase